MFSNFYFFLSVFCVVLVILFCDGLVFLIFLMILIVIVCFMLRIVKRFRGVYLEKVLIYIGLLGIMRIILVFSFLMYFGVFFKIFLLR